MKRHRRKGATPLPRREPRHPALSDQHPTASTSSTHRPITAPNITNALHPFPPAAPQGDHPAPMEHPENQPDGRTHRPPAPRTPPATPRSPTPPTLPGTPPQASPTPDPADPLHTRLATLQSDLHTLLADQTTFLHNLDTFTACAHRHATDLTQLLSHPARRTHKKRSAWDLEWDGMFTGLKRVLLDAPSPSPLELRDDAPEPAQNVKSEPVRRAETPVKVEVKSEVDSEVEVRRRSVRTRVPSRRARESTEDSAGGTPARAGLTAQERRARTAAATAARQRQAVERRARGEGSSGGGRGERLKTPGPRKRRKVQRGEGAVAGEETETDAGYGESLSSAERPPKGVWRPYEAYYREEDETSGAGKMDTDDDA